MSEPERYDTSSIEERISVFESRFTELTTRYADFSDVLKQLNARIDDHIDHGQEMLELARDEQEGANQKKGLAGVFAKRNQGRINAKILGAIERDFAILRDVKELTGRNMQLLNDTGEAVQRDVKEMMHSVVNTIQSYHGSTAASLRILGDDIELLKQLAAKDLLHHSGTPTNEDISDGDEG